MAVKVFQWKYIIDINIRMFVLAQNNSLYMLFLRQFVWPLWKSVLIYPKTVKVCFRISHLLHAKFITSKKEVLYCFSRTIIVVFDVMLHLGIFYRTQYLVMCYFYFINLLWTIAVFFSIFWLNSVPRWNAYDKTRYCATDSFILAVICDICQILRIYF